MNDACLAPCSHAASLKLLNLQVDSSALCLCSTALQNMCTSFPAPLKHHQLAHLVWTAFHHADVVPKLP